MQQIEIVGALLRLPDGTEIADCWDDRAERLLSRAAGLALMPYLNAQERQDAAHDRLMDQYEYGDPTVPAQPNPLYTYVVDGENAFPAKEVVRDPLAGVFGGGEPTGRMYLSTQSDIERLLGL